MDDVTTLPVRELTPLPEVVGPLTEPPLSAGPAGRLPAGEWVLNLCAVIVPFLVELTKYFTLWPGDVIWMGTDGASPDLKHGDVVEIDITGIGTLHNRFVREGQ